MLVDNCYWLNYNFLKTSKGSNFGIFSPFLSWSTSFFVLPKNLLVSGDNNSNL